MRYALPVAAASLTVSIIAAWIIGVTAAVVTAVVLLAFTLVFIFVIRKESMKLIALMLICITAGLGMFAARSVFDTRPCLEADGKTLEITACTVDIPEKTDYGWSCIVRVIKCEGDGPDRSFKAIMYSTSRIEAGHCEVFRCTARFSAIDSERSCYTYANSVYLSMSVDGNISSTRECSNRILRFFLGIREGVFSYFSEMMDGDVAGIICGILTGDKSGISRADTENFRACGVSHLVAVSGLHVSIAAAALLFLLTVAGVRKRYAALISCIGVAFFIAVIGFPASACRAGVMFAVLAFAFAIREEYLPVSALAAAILVILLVNPFAAVSPGFLLSVCAVMGILTMGMKLNSLMCEGLPESVLLAAPLRIIYASLSLTVASTVFTIPVSYVFFGSLSFASPVANIVAIPLAEVVFVTGALSFCLGLIPGMDFLGEPLALICGLCAKGLGKFCSALAEIAGEPIDISGSGFGWWIVLTLALIAGAFLLGGGKTELLIASVLSMAVLAAGTGMYHISNRGLTEIIAVDSKEGCATVIIYEDSAVVIGAPGDGREIISLLEKRRINNVLTLILPTLCSSCASGADELLLNNGAEIVCAPGKGECRSAVICSAGNAEIRESDRLCLTFFDDTVIMCYNTYVRITCRKFTTMIVFPYFDSMSVPEAERFADLLICGAYGADGASGENFPLAFVTGDERHSLNAAGKLKNNGIASAATGGSGNLVLKIYRDGDVSYLREE